MNKTTHPQGLSDVIQRHGGIIQEEEQQAVVVQPPGHPTSRRQSGASSLSYGAPTAASDLPDVVISESGEKRTTRMLAVMARGVAVLSDRWVRDCVARNRFVPPDSEPEEYVLRSPRPELRPAGIFSGGIGIRRLWRAL